MLLAASSQLVSAASSTCGYSRDCPRSYSLAAINASASLWDPTNATLQAAFEAERARALTRCSAVHGLGKGHELGGNSHGGWCLRSHNGINTTAFHKNCKGLTCRTFFLPKGPPQYYPGPRNRKPEPNRDHTITCTIAAARSRTPAGRGRRSPDGVVPCSEAGRGPGGGARSPEAAEAAESGK